jgi:hypothetical protein
LRFILPPAIIHFMAEANGNGHSNGHSTNGNGKKKPIPQSEREQPTDEQFEQRVAFCFNLLSQGMKPWDVRAKFCAEFGLKKRSADRYLTRARNLVAAQLKIPLSDLRNESLALYRAMSLDGRRKPAQRLRARALLDDLMGIRAPRALEHSGPKGGEIPLPAAAMPQLIVNVVTAVTPPAPTLNVLPEKT